MVDSKIIDNIEPKELAIDISGLFITTLVSIVIVISILPFLFEIIFIPLKLLNATLFGLGNIDIVFYALLWVYSLTVFTIYYLFRLILEYKE